MHHLNHRRRQIEIPNHGTAALGSCFALLRPAELPRSTCSITFLQEICCQKP